MKRRVWMLAVSLSALLMVQLGCAPPTNRGDSEAVSTPTKEVVDTAAIEREITRIENDYARVVKEKDVAAVQRVLADDAILIYPDGKLGDKATEIKDIQNGAMTFESWELADLKVDVLDKDAALATGRTIVKNGKIKLADGKTIDISGQYRFVDTFHRRDGQWKLVAGAAVALREPLPTASPSPVAKAASPAPAASPAASKTP
jgi:ketosteroid isomerase-like protein